MAQVNELLDTFLQVRVENNNTDDFAGRRVNISFNTFIVVLGSTRVRHLNPLRFFKLNTKVASFFLKVRQ
jgi:hypothetical protein